MAKKKSAPNKSKKKKVEVPSSVPVKVEETTPEPIAETTETTLPLELFSVGDYQVPSQLDDQLDLIQRIETKKDEGNVQLGLILCHIRESRSFAKYKGKQYKFNQFITSVCNISEATAKRNIQGIEAFTHLELDPKKLPELHWSQFTKFSNLILTDELDKDEVMTEILPAVTKDGPHTLPAKSIDKMVKEYKNNKDDKVKSKTITLKFVDDDVKLFNSCIKNIKGVDPDQVNLGPIVLEALSRYSAEVIDGNDPPTYGYAYSLLRVLSSLLPPGMMPVTMVYHEDSIKTVLENSKSALKVMSASPDKVVLKNYINTFLDALPKVYQGKSGQVIITSSKAYADEQSGNSAKIKPILIDPALMLEGAHTCFPIEDFNAAVKRSKKKVKKGSKKKDSKNGASDPEKIKKEPTISEAISFFKNNGVDFEDDFTMEVSLGELKTSTLDIIRARDAKKVSSNKITVLSRAIQKDLGLWDPDPELRKGATHEYYAKFWIELYKLSK